MSLDANVIPGVLSTLRAITDSQGGPLFRSVADGPALSIPESPTVWVECGSLESPPQEGSDLERSTWEVMLTVFYQYAPDQVNAETQLRNVIEPVRAAFRGHVTLGQPTIREARVTAAHWGYLEVNNIEYRTVVITVRIVEKQARTYSA